MSTEAIKDLTTRARNVHDELYRTLVAIQDRLEKVTATEVNLRATIENAKNRVLEEEFPGRSSSRGLVVMLSDALNHKNARIRTLEHYEKHIEQSLKRWRELFQVPDGVALDMVLQQAAPFYLRAISPVNATASAPDTVKVMEPKPPLGLIPRDIWWDKQRAAMQQVRLEDVRSAIKRYVEAGRDIPADWVREEQEITAELREAALL